MERSYLWQARWALADSATWGLSPQASVVLKRSVGLISNFEDVKGSVNSPAVPLAEILRSSVNFQWPPNRDLVLPEAPRKYTDLTGKPRLCRHTNPPKVLIAEPACRWRCEGLFWSQIFISLRSLLLLKPWNDLMMDFNLGREVDCYLARAWHVVYAEMTHFQQYC
jgi:hypothetical protein